MITAWKCSASTEYIHRPGAGQSVNAINIIITVAVCAHKSCITYHFYSFSSVQSLRWFLSSPIPSLTLCSCVRFIFFNLFVVRQPPYTIHKADLFVHRRRSVFKNFFSFIYCSSHLLQWAVHNFAKIPYFFHVQIAHRAKAIQYIVFLPFYSFAGVELSSMYDMIISRPPLFMNFCFTLLVCKFYFFSHSQSRSLPLPLHIFSTLLFYFVFHVCFIPFLESRIRTLFGLWNDRFASETLSLFTIPNQAALLYGKNTAQSKERIRSDMHWRQQQ